MVWTGAEGKRTLTVEVIIGLVVTLVGILLFVDVSLWVKLGLASLMAAIGLLNFLGLIGTIQAWRQNRYSRGAQNRFRKDSEFVSELTRSMEVAR